MKIAPVSTFSYRNNLNQKSPSKISFGDIDGDRIIINSKAKEIRMLSPQWEILNAQFKILQHQNSNIEQLGKKLMQEGYTMRFVAKEIQDNAQALAKGSIAKFDEALELVNEVKERNFESYYSYDYACGWSKREVERSPEGYLITEYDADDEMEAIRRVKISQDRIIFQDIRYVSGLIDEYVFDKDSKQLLFLTLGKSEGLAGGYKAQEQYAYDYTGELFSYARDYKTTKNADETIGEIYYFEPSRIQKYYKNYFNGGEPFKTTADKVLYFTREGCTRADIDYKEIDEKETVKRQFLFDTHGNIDACANDLKTEPHGLTSASSVYTYKNGILDKIISQYEAYCDNGVASAQKIFAYNRDLWHLITCGVKNRGIIGENYQIDNCMCEKTAKLYR